MAMASKKGSSEIERKYAAGGLNTLKDICASWKFHVK